MTNTVRGEQEIQPSDARLNVSNDVVAKAEQLPALTGVRFLAALAVVLSHFATLGLVAVPARLIVFLDGGRTAVSLFFVLSGFVLAYNYAGMSGGTDRRRFYVARFARIYPVVLLALLLAAVGVAYAYSRPDPLLDWYALKTNVNAALIASLGAQLTMTTGWFPIAAINQPWNGPAWSIACEMFFYAIFPLLLVTLKRRDGRHLLVICGATWAAQAGWIAGTRVLLPANRSGFIVSQFPITHLFEFVAGVAACLWFMGGGKERLSGSKRRGAALALSLIGITVLSWTMPVRPAYLLMTPLFALLVLALATPPRHQSLLGAPPLVLLGEASFTLYLLHVPMAHVMQIFNWQGAFGWFGMAIVISASIPLFLWYETPMRLAIRGRFTSRRDV